MIFENLNDLRERVIHCDKLDCPYRNRENGYYPKPSRGPLDSKLMLIFQNPGVPGGKNVAQDGSPDCLYSIDTITLEKATEVSILGQENWLFKTVGLDKSVWDSHGIIIGKSVYTTDVFKCPDPIDVQRKAQSKIALENCLFYLKEEIRLLDPKVIFTFGIPAKDAVAQIEKVKWPQKGIKSLSKEERVVSFQNSNRLYVIMPHPSGLWREPSMSISQMNESLDYAFRKAFAWAGMDYKVPIESEDKSFKRNDEIGNNGNFVKGSFPSGLDPITQISTGKNGLHTMNDKNELYDLFERLGQDIGRSYDVRAQYKDPNKIILVIDGKDVLPFWSQGPRILSFKGDSIKAFLPEDHFPGYLDRKGWYHLRRKFTPNECKDFILQNYESFIAWLRNFSTYPQEQLKSKGALKTEIEYNKDNNLQANNSRNCPDCGHDIKINSSYCYNCGSVFNETKNSSDQHEYGVKITNCLMKILDKPRKTGDWLFSYRISIINYYNISKCIGLDIKFLDEEGFAVESLVQNQIIIKQGQEKIFTDTRMIDYKIANTITNVMAELAYCVDVDS